MALANNNLEISSLDFFDMKQNFLTWLQGQEVFNSYDFTGSGMNILIDLLMYNTYYTAVYQNIIANESFLDTAQLRPNLLSLAKAINYVPMSATGAEARINIKVIPTASEDPLGLTTSLTINKYTKFLGAGSNGVKQPFVAVNSNTVSKIAGAFNFANVAIKQGEVITHQYPVVSDNRYTIPSSNVDITTLSVIVQTSASNTVSQVYTLADDITEVTANSAVYWVEEDNNLDYTVYFGDGYIGMAPQLGNIVIVTYLDTVGSIANNITTFYNVNPLGNLFSQNVTITPSMYSTAGSDKEDIDSIRFRAPKFYSTQNRAVTYADYETLVPTIYPNIDAISVWGGEDNNPPLYGQVFMSIKPSSYYSLTNADKINITNALISELNVVTVIPTIVDPSYSYVMISGSVTYDYELTNQTANELLPMVKSAITAYCNDALNYFDSTFRKSKLQYYIENSDPSITGSDLDIYLQQQVLLTFNQSKNYVIDFATPLQKGTSTSSLYTYPQIILNDSTGVKRSVYIEETPSSYTGIDGIDVVNPGQGYTSIPDVTITGDGSGATAVAVIVNQRLQSIQVIDGGINYTEADVVISGGGGYSGTAVAKLQSRYGNLRSFYYQTNGQKFILNSNCGTIDYDLGLVTLTNLVPLALVSNPYYNNNILTVNVVPEGDQIYPSRNRILTLNASDPRAILVNMVAED